MDAIDLGVKSNTEMTRLVNSLSLSLEVPKDSALTLTGSATPMTYASWISHFVARPAATTCLAAHLAAYAADRSTFYGSLPEKAPPP